MHVFDGLAHDRIGLYFKTHHGLIDGIGFIRVVLNTVSAAAGGRKPQALWQWTATAAPGSHRSGARKQRRSLSDVASGLAGRVARPATWRAWRGTSAGATSGWAGAWRAPFLATPDVLKAPPSPNRVLGHCALPLDRVRADCAPGGGQGERRAAGDARRGAEPLPGRTWQRCAGRWSPTCRWPCTTGRWRRQPHHHPAGAAGAARRDAGRSDSPTSSPRPATVKAEVRSISPDALFMYSIVEHAVASAIESLNLGDLPMLANAVISNPAGVDGKVYCNGLPVELALPVSVVAHHQVLNITISNYAGRAARHVHRLARSHSRRAATWPMPPSSLSWNWRSVRPRRSPASAESAKGARNPRRPAAHPLPRRLRRCDYAPRVRPPGDAGPCMA